MQVRRDDSKFYINNQELNWSNIGIDHIVTDLMPTIRLIYHTIGTLSSSHHIHTDKTNLLIIQHCLIK